MGFTGGGGTANQTDEWGEARCKGCCGVWKRLFRWLRRRVFYGYFSSYAKAADKDGIGAVRPDKLPPLWESDDIAVWSDRFISGVRRQLEKPGGAPGYALILTLFHTFWLPFLWIFVVSILEMVFRMLAVIYLGKFVAWQETGDAARTKEAMIKGDPIHAVRFNTSPLGISCGFATVLAELGRILIRSHVDFQRERNALQMCGALNAALFRCVLTPSRSNMKPQVLPNKKAKASAYNILMVSLLSLEKSQSKELQKQHGCFFAQQTDITSVSRGMITFVQLCGTPFLIFAFYKVLKSQVQC